MQQSPQTVVANLDIRNIFTLNCSRQHGPRIVLWPDAYQDLYQNNPLEISSEPRCQPRHQEQGEESDVRI